jgi:hypothetical protein
MKTVKHMDFNRSVELYQVSLSDGNSDIGETLLIPGRTVKPVPSQEKDFERTAFLLPGVVTVRGYRGHGTKWGTNTTTWSRRPPTS